MTPWLGIKLLHILLGAFWFGGAVVGTFYLTAAARALGPAAAPVLKYVIGVRKLSVALNIAAGINVLTGLALYDRLSEHFRRPLLLTFYERMLTFGAVFGILAVIWGGAVVSRSAKRLGAITMTMSGPPTPAQAAEIASLQQKMHVGGVVGVIMMVLAIVGMALSHPL
jgi:hypothetical protein